jgi:hypothetical protein
VSIVPDRVGLSRSTLSLYSDALQRSQSVTSQRIDPWTYYIRHEQKIAVFQVALKVLIRYLLAGVFSAPQKSIF